MRRIRKVTPKAVQGLVGRVIHFKYPAANYVGVAERRESRRVLVVETQDTSRAPVEEEYLKRDPHLRRGRFLVTGKDLDKMAERTFYVESMSDLRVVEPGSPASRPGHLRLGIYDPCEPDDSPELIGPSFRDIPEDRYVLRLAIDRYNKLVRGSSENTTCVGAFRWEGQHGSRAG